MKRIVSTLTVACAVVIMMLAMTGCQTSGRAAADDEAVICPHCQSVTSEVPCKNVKYTKAVCPTCGKVTTLSPTLRDAVASYVGAGAGSYTHVCENCQCIVGDCPVCQKK